MNLQQIRILGEALRRDLNLTEVAKALNTSQSGVSKHIMDLEQELGVAIFVRHGKRIVGLTEPGKELAPLVERILVDLKNIRSVATQFSRQDVGRLTIATTHTQARYSLPSVVLNFKTEFPGVELVLHQGGPAEIVALMMSGQADIAVATEALDEIAELVTFPYYRWHHAVIVPEGHPLLGCDPLTIESIAEYPIVTYSEGFTGRARVDEAFAKAGITPDLAISAIDADVIKTYVELGLGVGIVAAMAIKAEGEGRLRVLPGEHLFTANTTRIAVRRGNYLRGFACRFIQLCASTLTEADIRKAVHAREQAPAG
jgi:LysR family cys regulon transcriptional activator